MVQAKLKLFFIFCHFMLVIQLGFAQIDVVYNDLVWSDEFDQDGPLDIQKWHHQTLLPNGFSWYNGEVQHYTNRLANSFVENGILKIRAIKEPFTDQGITKQYTSARLNSKFAFQYGRVDIRAKIPTQQGTWPALWLLGKNINEPGGFFQPQFGTTNWPACGEIDIMEHGITPHQPPGFIQSAIHTPSSFGNTVNHGGTVAQNLGTDFHVYSMNWSPNQITFLLDGVPFYTYNPAVKNANTWPFDAEQYLLLNIAMGGVAGAIPSSFTEAIMEIDYVRVYQNTQVDTEPPTDLTASVGEVSSTSVELLLNAQDNSGTVFYTVNYGTNSVTFSHPAGVEKSLVISGLIPQTTYEFFVSASDLSGNEFIQNPVALQATTTGFTGCSGVSSDAQQGSFTIGYQYAFETIGTNVVVTFELLDTDKVGVVAYLWQQTPFSEVPMTQVSGNVFTATLTGLAMGTTISYAVKFAYAGGMSVTTYYTYVVGNNCTMGVSELQPSSPVWIQNPAKEYLKIHTDEPIKKVEIYSIQGKLIQEANQDFDQIYIGNLPKGIYFITVNQELKSATLKFIVH